MGTTLSYGILKNLQHSQPEHLQSIHYYYYCHQCILLLLSFSLLWKLASGPGESLNGGLGRGHFFLLFSLAYLCKLYTHDNDGLEWPYATSVMSTLEA